jgi:hypothetical protein
MFKQKKRRNVEFDALLKRSLFDWFHFGRFLAAKIEFFLWSGADCKFAGFTPSVVRIHSYPSLSRAILQVLKLLGG